MFTIDPKLEDDSILAAICGGVQVRLMRDSRYFWLVLVPQVEGAVEWHDLDHAMAAHVSALSRSLGQSIKSATSCTKINTAAIGNLVAMFHLHIVARSPGDPAWPQPIWGHGQPVPLTKAIEDWRLAVIRDAVKAFDQSRSE
jgi:diadenosine tetraphosphate (Ap4A) HIT family hydrolase